MTTRVANVISILALLSMVVMLAGLFGKWHYALDLASHLRLQATVTLLVAAVLLWPLQRRRWSVASGAVGLLLAASLVPFLWPSDGEGSRKYRLLSMNVLTSNPHPRLAIEFLVRANPDIVVLQETDHQWVTMLDEALLAEWPYRHVVPRSDNFGIALYSKLPWSSCETLDADFPLSTPSISATFELAKGQPLRVIATHPLPPMNDVYWRSRNLWFEQLATLVRSPGAERTIVAGDLNCTPWSPWFERLCRQSGLRNSSLGHGLGISWMPIPIRVCGLPIDHVLVGKSIYVHDRQTGPDVGSDHRPVIVDFQ